ncbi:hypothetical protein ACHAQA_004330 [Verticillium albo-atrum]
MELVAEAHVFAEKTGLGTEAMETLIEHQFGPLALSMSKRLTTGAYMPGRDQRPFSDLTLALKDVGHGINVAGKAGTQLQVAEVALDHLHEASRFSTAENRPLDSSSMSHMANIVALGSRRYLLDVGCGVDGPSQPLPLLSGEICDGLPRQQLRLEHKVLPQHSDPGQRVWVYAQRRDLGAWDEVYHFADVEFFPLDFEILNHYTVTKSYWAQVVVAQRFDFDDAKRISSLLFLFGDELKTGAGPSANMKLEEKVKTEQDRVAVLEEYFGVRLAEDERNAIRGHISEIIDIPPAGSA